MGSGDRVALQLIGVSRQGQSGVGYPRASRSCRRLVRRTTLQDRDIKEITWDEFRALFLEKFFPRYSRDMRYQEFLALTQGDSTVEEYTSRFAELRRFSPLQDERDMTQRFVAGLSYRIHIHVVG